MAMPRRHQRGRRNGEAEHRPADRTPAAPALTAAAPLDRGDRWRDTLLHAAIIVLAVLWIYSPVYHPYFPADWLWDDDQLLTANATVQSTTAASLAKLWFNPDGADYFPLSYSALWMQWPLFNMWPTGYHLTTILLHIAGSLLLWRLFSVMKLPGAWLGAALFAVHPVCVESVAWVSELKNTLSLPLFLLSAIAFIRYDDEAPHGSLLDPTPDRNTDTGLEDLDAETKALPAGGLDPNYAAAIGFFLLAMFAKTSVVMMPVAILLYAWWKRGRVTERDVIRSAPFFLISLILGIITIYYQHGRAIGQETIIVGGPDSRIATAGMSILFYLKLIFWPVHLLPIYPKWEVDPPKVWQFLPWPIIGFVGWWLWQNRGTWGRHVLFALGFFLLMVLPVLGFITISYMRITWAADHFIYLPMISIVGLVAVGIATWYERMSAGERPVLVAATATVLGLLALGAFRYAGAWVNEDALWTHTLMYNENAWQAHNRLGAKKFARGHVDDLPLNALPNPFSSGLRRAIESRGAFHHFTRSTALRPDLGETHNNLGTALSARAQMAGQRGDQAAVKQFMDKAIEQFAEACRVTPHVPAIHVNLANALAAAGRFDEAAKKYRELLDQAPDNAALWNNYGVALFKKGDKAPAIEAFRKALSIDPNLKDAKESLAVATGQAEVPQQPGQPIAPPRSPGEQLQLNPPQSPTLGPSPLLQR
jgi:tetratricopeptide (TPR) repeat protein